jgi:hypothetical protein
MTEVPMMDPKQDNGSFTIGSKNDITNQIRQSLHDQANHSSTKLT